MVTASSKFVVLDLSLPAVAGALPVYVLLAISGIIPVEELVVVITHCLSS